MANWDKLNAEFDALINKMTAEKWAEWQSNRPANRKIRKAEMLAKAKARF